MIRRIRYLLDEGHNAREIGGLLGINRRRVWRLARRNGIELRAGGDGRQVRVRMLRRFTGPLDRLAGRAGVSRSEIIERLLLVALDKDGRPAEALLGPLARPPRTYVRQPSGAAP